MQFRRIETPGLAHYAYIIGDSGVGAVIDPRRDVDEYLAAARELGLRIDFVFETHRQEDFVLGSSELANRTGAQVVNGGHECFGRGDLRLDDGESVSLGELRLRALHVPGHTPESMCYAVYLSVEPSGASDAETSRAWAVFTGDALLFGETGRTDLPAADRVEQNAALLYDSIHQKLAPLPDETLVFPAHGPGSVCGTGIADRPLSTLGLEKRSNPVFTLERAEFAARKAAEHLPRPPYFRHMEDVNLRGGIAPARRPVDLPLLSPDEFARASKKAVVIDTREPEAFAGGHIPGAYSIWLDGLASFGGWIASHEAAVYLCTNTDAEINAAFLQLARIGIDVRGALRGGFGTWRTSGRTIETTGVITPRELEDRRDELTVLDVREAQEFASAHIPNARNIYVGELEAQLGETESLGLDRRRPLAVTCGVGHRAGLAASILARAGFADVRNLLGGMKAWTKLELPTGS